MSSVLKLRDEHFGATLFDPETLETFFLDEKPYSQTKFVTVPSNLEYPRVDILTAPTKVYVDTTTKCNLFCKTCLNSSGKALLDELSTEDMLKIITKLGEEGVFYVKFSGGEPTVRKDWIEFVNQAKQAGLTVGMNSNGVYSPQTLEALVGSAVDLIDISFDGAEENHNFIRGNGTFERTLNSVRELSGAGKRITLNSVITRRTSKEDIYRLTQIAAEYAEDVCFFFPRPFGRAVNIPTLMPSYDEHVQTLKFADKVKEEYGLKPSSQSLSNSRSLAELGILAGGREGVTNFNIMSDGKMYAGGCVPYVTCSSKEEKNLGHIVDENHSVLNVWHNSKMLNTIRYRNSIFQERCDGCPAYVVECPGFAPEMEDFRDAFGYNPYCLH